MKRAEEAEEMIEMKKQLSLMKRKVSQMDTPSTTPADHTPLPLEGGEAPPTAGISTDTNDIAEREETPEQSNVDSVEVWGRNIVRTRMLLTMQMHDVFGKNFVEIIIECDYRDMPPNLLLGNKAEQP